MNKIYTQMIAVACSLLASGVSKAEDLNIVLSRYAELCEESGGTPITDLAVTILDLDASQENEYIFEPSKMQCNNGEESIYCGSGGCWIHFISKHSTAEILAFDWEIVSFGDRKVFIAAVRGDSCGPLPWGNCVRALTINEDRISEVHYNITIDGP